MAQPIKLCAEVERIVDHSPGLRSVWLRPERRVPRFRPGQFLHLAIDPYDPAQHWPDSRCFSIASPPEQRDRIRITVSAVGKLTRRILELRPGDRVWIKLPYGAFVVEAPVDRAVVLVAGGTGMTPFVSLLTSADAMPGPLRVVYGARRPNLLIYESELEAAATRWPDLAWQSVVEECPRERDRPGQISAGCALDAAGGSDARFYLSGPPGMIATVRAGLASAGVRGEDIVIDAWD